MDERMKKTDERYEAYLNILKKELVPAFGCTEPIAVAYAAACLRVLLGGEPETLRVEASGNIIKNVKSVIVPNTGGMKGIEAAAAAGIISGREDRQLEVLEELTEEERAVYRRGRNAKSATMAKHATMKDYRMATGFEALMGWLYLAGRIERLTQLVGLGLKKMGEL